MLYSGVYTVLLTLYTVQFTVYSVQFTVYTRLFLSDYGWRVHEDCRAEETKCGIPPVRKEEDMEEE